MKKIQLDNETLSELTKKLELFSKAGLMQSDAMTLLAEEEEDKTKKEVFSECAALLDEGKGLTEALSSVIELPTYAEAILGISEKVGRTEETLRSLSDYYESRARTSAQIRNTLLYPSILFVIMILTVVILISKVLPIFKDVYASLGGSLVGVAAGLYKLGELLNKALPYIGVVVSVLIIVSAIIFLFDSSRNYVKKLWKFAVSDRGVSKKLHNAHFAEALAMALTSGMTLEESIVVAGTVLADSPKASERAKNCVSLIGEGEDAISALQKADLLPISASNMLKLGLRAGVGDETAEKIAEKLSDEAYEALEEKISKIEPMLVLVTSVLVGVILLSVMLPLIDIMKVI